MPKVICTLPNASELISGVKFQPHERGVISEDVSDEQADSFLRIPGYELDGDKKQTVKPPADDAELEAMRAKATELGVKVNNKWARDRLQAEIDRAEVKAKAEAEAAAQKAAEEAAADAAKNGADGDSETKD